MAISFKPLHPTFVAEVSPIDLRQVRDRETFDILRDGMDRYAILVFRNQPFTDPEQLDFAQRFDGVLHARTSTSAMIPNRFGNEALSDISNVGADGKILPPDDRRRVSSLANMLWHTDASFVDPAGRYSMLSTRVLPPDSPNTEFADTRSAYDALDDRTKASLEGLQVNHTIAYSREVLGFKFAPHELEKLQGAVHPLVREFPKTGRKALYIASHASTIVGWEMAEARLKLIDLMAHATQERFVYRHVWRDGDLVIWDNRASMHRARPFDDRHQRRELRRTTTLDLPLPAG